MAPATKFGFWKSSLFQVPAVSNISTVPSSQHVHRREAVIVGQLGVGWVGL